MFSLKRKRDTPENLTEGKRIPNIVLIGDGCTGKSTFFKLMQNTSNFEFNGNYISTDDHELSKLNFETSDKKSFELFLWDTAGQETRGGELRDAYISSADAIIIMYDLTESKTKENVLSWINQIKKIFKNKVQPPIAVIGNKADYAETLNIRHTNIRDAVLKSYNNGRNIKSFLISIKEDYHINKSIKNEGCLIGLEYILSEYFKTDIKL